MKFSIFKSPKAQNGELCTREKYLEISNAAWLLRLCNDIAAEPDADKRGEMKKRLPAITWQAYFEGKRLAKEAQPSGLFMLDIDHVDNPGELYAKKVASRIKELGIVYCGMTASRHGLRIVAKCLPTLHSIEECQKWLASNLKVEYDSCCKDFARCSYLVHDSYTYFMDAKAIWEDEPAIGTVYAGGKNPAQDNAEFHKALSQGENRNTSGTSTGATSTSPSGCQQVQVVDQREGLFGGPEDYKGIPYSDIIKEWFDREGGEPTEGNRNQSLFKLAMRLRYITDFNEAVMFRIMPTYGLPESEVKSLIKSACSASRASNIPKDLDDLLKSIDRRRKIQGDDDVLPEIITETSQIPPLPPIIRQFVEVAPDDFKQAVALCQLPILGTLGSKLRAKYLDGQMHSPSFQVSLEAPQASGKSFMVRLAEYELEQIIRHDEVQRQQEQDYDKKVREMKLLNIKINADNKDEILGQRPQTMIRYCSPKMSVTKLLMRLHDAQGLHIFAVAPEIDTVTKAFKSGFSSYSDLLRNAFDNDLYGQDYASENSFSGIVPVYYNTLFSGTPKAMRRFYPDVEDGLVSRVCFVTLPDQFGKPMPVWKDLEAKNKAIVDTNLVRLNEVSIVGDEVQEDHVLKMDWLNKEIEGWIKAQQVEAVKNEDRTRDIFCRRSAVVGFRAGMLAYFLYGEKNTPTIRKNCIRFAIWVANCMLNQHLLRFNIQGTGSNTILLAPVFERLGTEFTRDDVEKALAAEGSETQSKVVLYKWRLAGLIESTKVDRTGAGNRKTMVKFKKIQNN